jgi:hypothetical protein
MYAGLTYQGYQLSGRRTSDIVYYLDDYYPAKLLATPYSTPLNSANPLNLPIAE